MIEVDGEAPEKSEDEPYKVGPGKPPLDKRFVSGDPRSGRPKGSASITHALRRSLTREMAEGLNRALIDATLGHLESGVDDVDRFAAGLRGYNTICDRADGKPRQVTETTIRTLSPLDTTPRNATERAAAAAALLASLGAALPPELVAALEVPDPTPEPDDSTESGS